MRIGCPLYSRDYIDSIPNFLINLNISQLSVYRNTLFSNNCKQQHLQISLLFKTPASVPETSQSVGQISAAPNAGSSTGTKRKRLELRPVQSRKRHRSEYDNTYESTKRLRVFQETWLNDYSWLRFDRVGNVMYCDTCREFDHLHPKKDISLIKGIIFFIITKLSNV